MTDKPIVHKLLDGDAYAWIEQGTSLMLKVATRFGDPVEMQWDEARALARLLLRLADQGESADRLK